MKNRLSSSMEEKVVPCKVTIDSFPSRNEVIQMLDNFLSDNGYRKDYICNNKDNSITINFQDSNIAFEFLKVVNSYKMKNPIYSKIRTALAFESNKPTNSTHNYSLNNSRLYKSTVTKAKENHKTMEGRYLTEATPARYINKRTPLRISDPYVDPKQLAYIEYAQNKRKWLNPNGFRPEVNAIKYARMSELGTCVTRTEGKYTYKNFIFREANKKKWLSDKNFSIRHLPEYL